ncbi:MAG: hypothetical protein ACTHOE_15260 [Conexibacter sp.]
MRQGTGDWDPNAGPGESLGGRARLPIVAIGCILLVVAVAAKLSHAVPVRTGTNDALATTALGGTVGRLDVCQTDELIPAGTGGVRVWLRTTGRSGPALALVATNGREVIGRGTLAAGWSGRTATIPLRPVTRAQRSARICVAVGASASVTLAGEVTDDPDHAGPPATASGEQLRGRLRIEYLTPQRRSWWSQIGTLARRVGFGRTPGGSAVAFVAALLMLVAVGLGARQLVRSTP